MAARGRPVALPDDDRLGTDADDADADEPFDALLRTDPGRELGVPLLCGVL